MVERNGRVYAKPVSSTDAATLHGVIKERVEKGSQIFTDEFPAYQGLELECGHDTINHKAGSYVDGNIHTHTIDGYWSLLKRGIYGIYHQVNSKRLHRYCAEFDYRYNLRKSGEAERFDSAIKFIDG